MRNLLPLLLDFLTAITCSIRVAIAAYQVRRAEQRIDAVFRECKAYLESTAPPPAHEKWIDEIEARITQ